MSSSEIPSSAKSPLSLNADYANPKLYGWASTLAGVLSLLVGIPMLSMSSGLSPVAFIIALGTVLFVAGVWVVRRGK